MSGGTSPTVRLPSAIATAIVEHARAAQPQEACGLVVGSGHHADGGVARRYVPCRNAAASRSRFLVDRDDLLAVLRALDGAGEELWGVVHSHVRTPAAPSATDVAEAAWPAAVHLLVSLAGDAQAGDAQAGDAQAGDGRPVLRAWRIADGAARELALEIEDAA